MFLGHLQIEVINCFRILHQEIRDGYKRFEEEDYFHLGFFRSNGTNPIHSDGLQNPGKKSVKTDVFDFP